MVKLVRIYHDRCGEPDGTTWCFAPDDWDEERFNKAVLAARRGYQDAVNAYMEAAKEQGFPPSLYGSSMSPPNYAKYPDLTVKEVQEKHKAESERLARLRGIALAGTHNFGWFLEHEGFVQFHNAEPDFSTELNWGHQHGAPLKYKQESPWDLDKSGIAKEEED